MKNKTIKKDFIWNSLGSAIHAFNCLFFLVIVTRINGIDVAGYFSYGFTISNIFLVIATFGGRNYQVTDIKNEFSDGLYKKFRYVTTIITIIIMFLFFLLFNYPFYKYITIVLLIFARSFESLSDVYFGIIQKKNKLYLVGKSLFYKNLVSLIAFVSLELVFKNIYYSIIGWAVVNALFLLIVDIPNAKKIKFKKTKNIPNKKIIEILKKTSFFFAFNFISIFVLNIPRYFIDFYLTDEIQGFYGILIVPVNIVVLLTQFVLQPYIVRLSEKNKSNKKEFNEEIKKIFKTITLISIVCILLTYLFGIQALNFIYGLDLNDYLGHLIVVIIGASLYALNSFLSLIYTIKRKIKYQFILYLITIIFSSIISYFLVTLFTFWGGVISYTLTMLIIFIFYIIKLKNY